MIPPCLPGMKNHVYVGRSKVCAVCWLDVASVQHTVAASANARKPIGFPCAFCGNPADSWDHLIPRARGGLNRKKNKVPACTPCNNAKGDRTPLEWLGEHCPARWRGLAVKDGSIASIQPKRPQNLPRRIRDHLAAHP